MVLAQYYNLLRLGHSGYSQIIKNCVKNARYLAQKLSKSGCFKLIGKTELPIVTFGIKQDVPFSAFQLSEKLREKGWMLPAYHLPRNLNDMIVMRVVVRETFSRDMAERLFADIMEAYKFLEGPQTDNPNVHKQPDYFHPASC